MAAAAPASIQITVDRPEHLFNALDPAPLIGRDLDEKIERYVVHLARETDARGYAMTIQLSEVPSENLDEFGKAIGVFFAHRRDEEAQKLRLLLREGRHALAIGLAFLSLCVFFGLVSLRTIPERMRSPVRSQDGFADSCLYFLRFGESYGLKWLCGNYSNERCKVSS